MNKLIAANWKMYKTAGEAAATSMKLVTQLDNLSADREVVLFPSFTDIAATAQVLAIQPRFAVGGQNFYPAKEGPYTGEISPGMLLAAGCTYGLTGHSERRYVLGETDELVGRKTVFGLENGLKIILCVGEQIKEREAKQLEVVLKRQLTVGLAEVPGDISPEIMIIAYEPVWAIGTGNVPRPLEILEAHAVVRKHLVRLLPTTGSDIRILYGGSVHPDNCDEIISLDNVDGVLVGKASLDSESFIRICRVSIPS